MNVGFKKGAPVLAALRSAHLPAWEAGVRERVWSRSVFGGSRLPDGTGKSLEKEQKQSSVPDVQRGIFVSIKHHTTGRTNVGTDRETLFDACATYRAILRGEPGRYSNDGDIMHCSIVVHPLQKFAPRCIADTLREMTIAHHVGYLQVFIGKEIVRCH